MLSADPPNFRGGGGIRSYFFARAVAEKAQLNLAVLLPGDSQEIPNDLLEACASFHRPNRGFLSAKQRSKMEKFGPVFRIFPWIAGSHELTTQARRYCADRPEQGTEKNILKRIALTLYRLILEIQISVAYRFCGYYPSRTAERLKEFRYLLPALVDEFKNSDIDLIWLEHSFLFPFVPELEKQLGRIPVICNAHNVEYTYHSRMADIVQSASARRWWKRQATVMKKMEADSFGKAQLSFSCSDKDLEDIKAITPAANVITVPNGVDTEYFSNNSGTAAGSSVVFTGAMGYSPNQDAVNFFVNQILPIIRAEVSDCQFIIAGSSAKDRFKEIENKDPLVKIFSDVTDIRPIIENATVVVVPLRIGSGTRLKILEAMSLSKAIVSTSIGAEGLEFVEGENIRIADSPEDFASVVIELLSDANQTRRLGENARRLVCERYDWHNLMSTAIQQVYQQLN